MRGRVEINDQYLGRLQGDDFLRAVVESGRVRIVLEPYRDAMSARGDFESLVDRRSAIA